MAEISGDGGGFLPEVSNGRAVDSQATPTPIPAPNPTSLTVSGSFKEGKSSSRRRTSVRPSMDADDFFNLFPGSDPVKLELNRLENEVRGAKCGSICCFFSSFYSMFCVRFVFLSCSQIRIESSGKLRRRSRH